MTRQVTRMSSDNVTMGKGIDNIGKGLMGPC